MLNLCLTVYVANTGTDQLSGNSTAALGLYLRIGFLITPTSMQLNLI